jgi:Ca2+-binding RTX toxin-like protein
VFIRISVAIRAVALGVLAALVLPTGALAEAGPPPPPHSVTANHLMASWGRAMVEDRAGYSYVVDHGPDTMPNSTVDTTVEQLMPPTTVDGTWYFHIVTVDTEGFVSTPVHVGPFVRDTTAPVVQFIAGPAEGSTVGAGAQTVTFTSDDPAASYHCSPTGVWLPCMSPVTLPEGQPGIGVYAEDAAGNRSASVYRSWTRNRFVAVINVNFMPWGPGERRRYVSWIKVLPDGFKISPFVHAEGAAVVCLLDGRPVTCGPDMTFPTISLGRHLFSVTVTDAFGESTSESATWQVVDFLPPTKGADKVRSSARTGHVIRALGGNDTVFGNVWNDKLFGDAGNDSLYGVRGNDTLDGGAGNDLLSGDQIRFNYDKLGFPAGRDVLRGGAGNDRLAGGPGADSYFGGAGSDQIVDVTDNVRDIVDCGPGRDTAWISRNDVAIGCEKVLRGPDHGTPQWWQ